MANEKVIVTKFGGPEVLSVIEEQLFPLDKSEIRVKILTAGISFADLLMREGLHPEAKKPPFTLGWDIIGEVSEIGSKVTHYKPGDIVAALTIRGGYAKYITLKDADLVPVPDKLNYDEAICLVMNYIVAYQMLFRFAMVNKKDTILIHSATGGVGSAIFELARLHNIKCYGTVSTENIKSFKSKGGLPIDYKNENFVEVIKKSEPKGITCVFDGIGGNHLWESYQVLRRNGKLIFYGLTAFLAKNENKIIKVLNGAINFIKLYILNIIPGYKRIKLYSIQELKKKHPDWYKEDLTKLFLLLKEQKIKPIIHSKISLDKVADAHILLKGKGIVGKIIIENK